MEIFRSGWPFANCVVQLASDVDPTNRQIQEDLAVWRIAYQQACKDEESAASQRAKVMEKSHGQRIQAVCRFTPQSSLRELSSPFEGVWPNSWVDRFPQLATIQFPSLIEHERDEIRWDDGNTHMDDFSSSLRELSSPFEGVWPNSWVDRFPQLATIQFPSLIEHERHGIRWDDGNTHMDDFSVSATSEALSGSSQTVPWTKVVWFKGHIAKHAFCM
ncbi:hypothetical protein L6452_36336 [Arctium lappa]|uniref:Uncharacterized protein n=1 Tax=Arctium lappa TaxID=4217 RepID=A0ACB8Y869_ARCLA|nr:hypothetical protein L6452_36336 [Arctium lappa]